MIEATDNIILRLPEPEDVQALYAQKNDPEVSTHLGGFSRGYTVADIAQWVETRRTSKDDLVWVIANRLSGTCLGHVGLYQIDHRVRSAEFAIMIGDKSAWGQGIGTFVTRAVLRYGYRWLNLNRIQLTVLESNSRALAMYRHIGFQREGVLRDAQYKDGRYVSLILMSQLRNEFTDEE